MPLELSGIYWSGYRDSNPRHPAWEADVLPLNYTRFWTFIIQRIMRPEKREGSQEDFRLLLSVQHAPPQQVKGIAHCPGFHVDEYRRISFIYLVDGAGQLGNNLQARALLLVLVKHDCKTS
jgi:hypothetical protein